MARSPTTRKRKRATWLSAAALTVVLHFTWEMAQSPFFEDFANGWIAGTAHCLRASLGDLVIAAMAYTAASLFVRRFDWPIAAGWLLPGVTWIGVSEAITIAFERYAVQQGRWAYAPDMPMLFGIGLLPLAQWIVVPLVTLFLLRALVR